MQSSTGSAQGAAVSPAVSRRSPRPRRLGYHAATHAAAPQAAISTGQPDRRADDAPARRTGPAWREEENRPAPASQQVIASAVTGPTSYSRAASTLAPGQMSASIQQPVPTACSRASSASITSSAVATCSCPAGDR